MFTAHELRLRPAPESDIIEPFTTMASGQTSYPRNKIKVLLLENIHSDAAWNLKDAGWDVERLTQALRDQGDFTGAVAAYQDIMNMPV